MGASHLGLCSKGAPTASGAMLKIGPRFFVTYGTSLNGNPKRVIRACSNHLRPCHPSLFSKIVVYYFWVFACWWINAVAGGELRVVPYSPLATRTAIKVREVLVPRSSVECQLGRSAFLDAERPGARWARVPTPQREEPELLNLMTVTRYPPLDLSSILCREDPYL